MDSKTNNLLDFGLVNSVNCLFFSCCRASFCFYSCTNMNYLKIMNT